MRSSLQPRCAWERYEGLFFSLRSIFNYLKSASVTERARPCEPEPPLRSSLNGEAPIRCSLFRYFARSPQRPRPRESERERISARSLVRSKAFAFARRPGGAPFLLSPLRSLALPSPIVRRCSLAIKGGGGGAATISGRDAASGGRSLERRRTGADMQLKCCHQNLRCYL